MYLSPPQQWRRASTDIIIKIWVMEVLALPSLCLDAVWPALLYSALDVQLRFRVLTSSVRDWKNRDCQQSLGSCVWWETHRGVLSLGFPMKTSVAWRVLLLFVVANLIFVLALQFVLYIFDILWGQQERMLLVSLKPKERMWWESFDSSEMAGDRGKEMGKY